MKDILARNIKQMNDINYQLLSFEENKLNSIKMIYRFHHRDQIKYVELVHGVH